MLCCSWWIKIILSLALADKDWPYQHLPANIYGELQVKPGLPKYKQLSFSQSRQQPTNRPVVGLIGNNLKNHQLLFGLSYIYTNNTRKNKGSIILKDKNYNLNYNPIDAWDFSKENIIFEIFSNTALI